MRKNVGQKSVDMGLRPDKNMGGWVGFFISRPHTPVTFLDKCSPPRVGCTAGIDTTPFSNSDTEFLDKNHLCFFYHNEEEHFWSM